MADDLSDFFAKQDKKKKKQKKSSKVVAVDLYADIPTPPNEINDNGDQIGGQISQMKIDNSSTDADSTKEKKKQKKKRDKDGTDGTKEEDEWNVQKEADYSGLRIATKNIAQEAANEANEAGNSETEYDEHGQPVDKNEAVWKIAAPDPATAPLQEVTEPAPAPVIAAMPNVEGGRYVPPSRRNAAAASALPAVSVKRYSKKTAPNMNSQEDFPTLGAAPPPIDYDPSKFEKVRGGSSQQQQVQSGPNRLQTSNMYSALERN